MNLISNTYSQFFIFKLIEINMKSKFVLFLLFFVLNYSFVISQNTDIAPSSSENHSLDKGLANEVLELEKFKQKYAKEISDFEIKTQEYVKSRKKQNYVQSSVDTSCTMIIPVVFHVFHPSGASGVPLSQINYAIADLNRTFAGSDDDFKTVNSKFENIKSNTKIRFALAKKDPEGNPSSGVNYYQDRQGGFGNGSGWDQQIASIAWDNYKYFNVYIMNDLYANNTTNNSGVCWYPNTYMSDMGLARMVYNYWYFGYGGSSFNNVEFNQTFTHECGHFLNLIHTFEGGDCSAAGDLCDDTPPTDIAAAGCNASRCGGLINGENYMDYNASCYKNFTKDQNFRMEAAMNHPTRASLWQYDNLVACGVMDQFSSNSCFQAAPFLSFSKKVLNEDNKNDGSIAYPEIDILACGAFKFLKAGQILENGTDYTITNLPEGLQATVQIDKDSTKAKLIISGNAIKHDKINSLENVNLAFTGDIFTQFGPNTIKNSILDLKISFKDPWKETCVTMSDFEVDTINTWKRFETEGDVPRYYGLWYNKDKASFHLENYGRALITDQNNNLIFLTNASEISEKSNWHAGDEQAILYSSKYTNLEGSQGYIGFRMQKGNDYFYGWMKVSVSKDKVSLLEYHYNNKANAPIYAGIDCNLSGIENLESDISNLIYPNPTNSKIYIDIQDNFIPTSLVISNQYGQVLKTLNTFQISNQQIIVDVQDLSASMYFLTLQNTNNSKSYKFVKGE